MSARGLELGNYVSVDICLFDYEILEATLFSKRPMNKRKDAMMPLFTSIEPTIYVPEYLSTCQATTIYLSSFSVTVSTIGQRIQFDIKPDNPVRNLSFQSVAFEYIENFQLAIRMNKSSLDSHRSNHLYHGCQERSNC